jgi:Domain of unknown function (DUF6458)
MFAALGILMIVAGAILTFAVNDSVDNVDLEVIGWILMGGGALALIVAAIVGAGWMASTRSRVVTERHVSGDGRHSVEDSRAS